MLYLNLTGYFPCFSIIFCIFSKTSDLSSLLKSKDSSLYRWLSKTNFSASELLNILNSEICETTSRGMFVTMLIGIYDSNKQELTLANAGHEPPLIYSKDGSFSNFEEAGPPLGIIEKTE